MKEYLPFITLSLALMILAYTIFDIFVPFMNFTYAGNFKDMLQFLCLAVILNSIYTIVLQKKLFKAEYESNFFIHSDNN